MIALRDLMESPEGWGREQGRAVFQRLLKTVESDAEADLFRVSLQGVERIDISFASETIVELARRFRCEKGFFLVDVTDEDLIENIEAAAARKAQPVLIWSKRLPRILGVLPTHGTRDALDFALKRSQVRAAEYVAERAGVTIANASMKFKQLWQQGFLLRQESAADSGGTEYVYSRIG